MPNLTVRYVHVRSFSTGVSLLLFFDKPFLGFDSSTRTTRLLRAGVHGTALIIYMSNYSSSPHPPDDKKAEMEKRKNEKRGKGISRFKGQSL
jgi:hypothetical protein